jgi:hypothetical protein
VGNADDQKLIAESVLVAHKKVKVSCTKFSEVFISDLFFPVFVAAKVPIELTNFPVNDFGSLLLSVNSKPVVETVWNAFEDGSDLVKLVGQI